MFKLLVCLCLSLYCAMVVYGNGPARTALHERPEPSATSGASGIRILPAPAPVIPAPVIPAAAAPAVQRPVPVLVVGRPEPAPASTLPANLQLRWIAAGTANVRAAPNKRSALAGKIGRGGAVHVMWTEPNGWVRVRSATGDVTGFVHKSLLTDEAPPTASVEMATAD